MFKEFFLREIKGAFGQPMIYIFFIIFAFVTGMGVGSDNVVIGGSIGNVFKNAPHVVTTYTIIMSIFGLLVATAFFNNAALRDHNAHFNEILFSTPLSKSGYFFGRFFGALFLSTVPMIGVFTGIILGSLLGPVMGDLSPDRIGPFYFESFFNNYILFVLPNMLFAGAIVSAMAHKFKSTVISFVGTLVIIVAYSVSSIFLSDIESETIAALIDSFGFRAYSVEAKYFTPLEKNTLSPSFSGLVLYNRLIWTALGIGILFLSYFSFSFKTKQKKGKAEKTVKTSEDSSIPLHLPRIAGNFNFGTEFQQFKSFFMVNFLSIAKSITFKILFLFSLVIYVADLAGGFEYMGLKSYPVTYKLAEEISESTGLFIFIVLVFFSGELIWRDRMNKINEVVDATPHTSLTSLVAKSLSLVSIVFIFYAFFILIAVVYQLLHGFTFIEFNVYFTTFLVDYLPGYIAWSFILVFLQTIINNRYVGYFAAILIFFIQNFLWSILDIESNMLSIGSVPSLQYSDMNGFGPGLIASYWFNLYWILLSTVLLLVAGLLWNRGVSTSLFKKVKGIKQHLSPKYVMILSVFGLLWTGTAGFVYYNTQVLNTYKTSDQVELDQVEYEKKYKKYQHIAQPKLTNAIYHIDIFPYKRDVIVKADLIVKNLTNQSIDSLHYSVSDKWKPEIQIKGAELVHNDKELGYQIFKLAQPLAPNDSLPVTIHAQYITKGFENERGNTSIIANGTFLNSMDILPYFGYGERYEIGDKNTRKKYDLPAKLRVPELQENCDHQCAVNYLSEGKSDWINVETFISTAEDQVAIAPGSLVKEWKKDGRNYYHYKVDHPSQNFYSFISARYEVAKKKWNDVDIEVYYDQKHAYNVDMMIKAVERSLEYYSKNFGPYFHKQARIIEFPRYATFAQAFPGTMPYSESFGFIIDLEDEEKNNVIDAVIAHEMAHQWWAHQEVAANMQGGTMLTESFAEYSSLMVMKSVTDKLRMKNFLKYDMNRYLRGRSRETEKETPLYKVENQSYIHYGKGSVILYALQDYIGEEKVNRALRAFLSEFRYAEPPYPTSLDFLKHLEQEVPDSLNYLITDWFKEITLYDNRLKTATYKPLDNGKYLVTMALEAKKIKADSIGNETVLTPNDWVDIGVFADKDEKELIYEKRMKFDKKDLVFSFEVDTIPAKAAIDPRRILIERVYKDNIKSVSQQ